MIAGSPVMELELMSGIEWLVALPKPAACRVSQVGNRRGLSVRMIDDERLRMARGAALEQAVGGGGFIEALLAESSEDCGDATPIRVQIGRDLLDVDIGILRRCWTDYLLDFKTTIAIQASGPVEGIAVLKFFSPLVPVTNA